MVATIDQNHGSSKDLQQIPARNLFVDISSRSQGGPKAIAIGHSELLERHLPTGGETACAGRLMAEDSLTVDIVVFHRSMRP